MKKIYKLALFLILVPFLTACPPGPEPTPEVKYSISNEVLIPRSTTVSVSANYVYQDTLTLQGISLVVSKRGNMTDSLAFEATYDNKSFNVDASGLSINTKYNYYYRFENEVEPRTTQIRQFTTDSIKLATLTTGVFDFTATTATLNISVIDDGGDTVSARGICWSTMPEPTVMNDCTNEGQNCGIFNSTANNLTPKTQYYLRAYATNTIGTQYGEEISFITPDVTYNINGSNVNFVLVENGTFWMGGQNTDSTAPNYNLFPYEGDPTPVHQVTISNDYYIGQTEVTQGLWKAVMGSWAEEETSTIYGLGLNLPIYFINWEEAQVFINRLNEMTGKTFRLPTEAEWEFAARGGNLSQGYIYSGSNYSLEVGWVYTNSSSGDTPGEAHSIHTRKPNELGIYDMTGNMNEWCQDWHSVYNAAHQTDPTGPATGTQRIYRGGGYFNVSDCRTACRYKVDPSYSNNEIGLRLVLEN